MRSGDRKLRGLRGRHRCWAWSREPRRRASRRHPAAARACRASHPDDAARLAARHRLKSAACFGLLGASATVAASASASASPAAGVSAVRLGGGLRRLARSCCAADGASAGLSGATACADRRSGRGGLRRGSGDAAIRPCRHPPRPRSPVPQSLAAAVRSIRQRRLGRGLHRRRQRRGCRRWLGAAAWQPAASGVVGDRGLGRQVRRCGKRFVRRPRRVAAVSARLARQRSRPRPARDRVLRSMPVRLRRGARCGIRRCRSLASFDTGASDAACGFVGRLSRDRWVGSGWRTLWAPGGLRPSARQSRRLRAHSRRPGGAVGPGGSMRNDGCFRYDAGH